jgi:hypothetical protein
VSYDCNGNFIRRSGAWIAKAARKMKLIGMGRGDATTEAGLSTFSSERGFDSFIAARVAYKQGLRY